VEAVVQALTSILEPVMIVIVGFIVIAMYLPMFKVYDQIK
jgi:type IV pilus assembly protein PilC